MSFAGLNIGRTGVSAAQRGVEAAGHNASNVNTPGFTRQRVNFAAAVPSMTSTGLSLSGGMVGTGVTVQSISRLRDSFLDSSWRAQAAVAADAAATADILGRVENLIGTVTSGLPKMANQFFASWSDLSINPSDPAARQAVLSAGEVVARELSTIASQLNQIGPDSTSKAVDLVTEANALIEHVARLNVEIANATSMNQSPNDLLDSRDQLIDQLSGLIGARVGAVEDNGQVALYLEGQPLVRGKYAYPLDVTTTPSGPVVSFANGTVANPGGQIGGLIKTATTMVPEILAGFDEWASNLINEINAIHAGGAGVDGTRGNAFFSGNSASTIAVAATTGNLAASTSGLAADGSNALKLMQLADTRDVNGTTIGDRLRGMFSAIGLTNQQAQLIASTSNNTAENLDLARQSVHAVNADEEMVDMVRFQRAYEANAKVISICDGLLDTIINRT